MTEPTMKKIERMVMWGVPMPRAMPSMYADTLISVAQRTPYPRIRAGFNDTARNRNIMCDTFLANSYNDHDALVMLDVDHLHPSNVVLRLTQHVGKGVIGGMAMNRNPKDPYPMVYKFDDNLDLTAGFWFPRGEIVKCDMISPCGILIERWVLVKLKEQGFYPWWQYLYSMWPGQNTEDYYFGLACYQSDIPHYCDTSMELPHNSDDNWLTMDDWIEKYETETGERYEQVRD